MSDVEFDDRFPSIIAEIPVRTALAEVKVARSMARIASALAPRLKHPILFPSTTRIPGYLAESIEAATTTEGSGIRINGPLYGFLVEYGTPHMRAEPFLRPAAAFGESVFVHEVADELEGL